MIRCLMLLLLLVPCPALAGQDTGRSLLSAARKRAREARGLEGAERAAIFEDTLRILRMVPERFPDERPAVARAWLEMGRLLRRLDRGEEAVEALEKACTFTEEQRPVCDALHELASHYRKLREREQARAVLRRIVDEYPSQARPRARALIRMASLHREEKSYEKAEELLLQCLEEHGDLWRQAVDALDALVALKLRMKDIPGARSALDRHSKSLRARFAGTSLEARLERALMKMRSRPRLERMEGGPQEPPDPGGGGGTGPRR